jgi:hypothetical protein
MLDNRIHPRLSDVLRLEMARAHVVSALNMTSDMALQEVIARAVVHLETICDKWGALR